MICSVDEILENSGVNIESFAKGSNSFLIDDCDIPFYLTHLTTDFFKKDFLMNLEGIEVFDTHSWNIDGIDSFIVQKLEEFEVSGLSQYEIQFMLDRRISHFMNLSKVELKQINIKDVLNYSSSTIIMKLLIDSFEKSLEVYLDVNYELLPEDEYFTIDFHENQFMKTSERELICLDPIYIGYID